MSDASAGRAANATRDAFLGGLVQLLQPARGTGHRAGLDAVYLAAAVDPSTTGHVLDLGSGSGAAGFCLAARVPGVTVSLVDRDTRALALAADALDLPENGHFADRVARLEADITGPGREFSAG